MQLLEIPGKREVRLKNIIKKVTELRQKEQIYITGVLYDESRETKGQVPMNVVDEESDDSRGGMNGKKSKNKNRGKIKVIDELLNCTVYNPPR